MKSLYDILCVNKNATAEEIKSSFRKLAHANHPDKNDGKGAERMAKIAEAYKILSNEETRMHYDLTGQIKQTDFEKEFNEFVLQLILPIIETHPNLEESDILKEIQTQAYKGVNQMHDEVKKLEKLISKISKFIKRLRPNKDTVNRMAVILETQKEGHEQTVQAIKAKILNINKCITHISEYGYDIDKPKIKTEPFEKSFLRQFGGRGF